MVERLLGRSKRALVIVTHATTCATLAAPLSVSLAHAQPAAPPTPVPTLPASAPASTATASSTSAPATPAQPTPAQLAEAKKFFEAGLKLLKEGLYQEALASFLEANRISPRESIQNNIALSYRNLKDLANAYTAYEDLLARYGDKMKPAAKADAQHAIEELAVLTGLVTIKVQEPDAKVTLDGKEVGRTPIAKPLRVNIGSHNVVVAKQGFETITQDVVIKGHDEGSVDGPLVKEILTGHVSVTVGGQVDATAKILVDGKEVGPAPWQGDLEPGSHVFEARGDASIAPAKPLDVAKKGKYDVALELKPAQGTLAVATGTADGEITVDGQAVGRGAWEGAPPVGKHELGVTKQGFIAYKASIIVRLNERLAENVALQPDAAHPIVPPHDWRGVYGQLNFIGVFPLSTSNDIAQGRGLTSDTGVTTSGSFGGAIEGRVGYSLGIIGIEGFITGGYDHTAADISFTSAQSNAQHPGGDHTESFAFHRFGGATGLAVRVMPKLQIARPTLGVGVGVAIKSMLYTRDSSVANGTGGSNSYTSDLATYVAPTLVFDGGVQLGKTPGTRFYIGARLALEFPGGAQATASNPANGPAAPAQALDLANGTDVFFGPILGMQFGE